MSKPSITIGWREWGMLPEPGLPGLKAKIDTWARTSCQPVYCVDCFRREGDDRVRIDSYPHQGETGTEVCAEEKVADVRMVTDSGGHKNKRCVITAPLRLANQHWPVEIPHTNRDTMPYRMLVRRTAMVHRFPVSSKASYLPGKPKGILIEKE